jgi:hypothetical protein
MGSEGDEEPTERLPTVLRVVVKEVPPRLISETAVYK